MDGEDFTSGSAEFPNMTTYGDIITAIGTATKVGSTFDAWYLDVTFETAVVNSTPLTSNITLYAKFVLN